MEKVECSECGNKYTNSKFLGEHIINFHRDKTRNINWLKMKGNNRYHTKCLNCNKLLPIKVPYSILEEMDIDLKTLYEDNMGNTIDPPFILFCRKECKKEFTKVLKEEKNRYGMPDTAMRTETYEDQYDFNR